MKINFSKSTLIDVLDAFKNSKHRFGNLKTQDWVYDVDPETMTEIKTIYKNSPGNFSLYFVFCMALREAKKLTC